MNVIRCDFTNYKRFQAINFNEIFHCVSETIRQVIEEAACQAIKKETKKVEQRILKLQIERNRLIEDHYLKAKMSEEIDKKFIARQNKNRSNE